MFHPQSPAAHCTAAFCFFFCFLCRGFKGHAAKKAPLWSPTSLPPSHVSFYHTQKRQEHGGLCYRERPCSPGLRSYWFFSRGLCRWTPCPPPTLPPTVTRWLTRPLDKGEEDLSLWVTPGFSCPLLLSFSASVALSVLLLRCTQTQRQTRGVALYPLPTTRTFRLNRQNRWHLCRRCFFFFFLLIGTVGDSHHFPTAELQPC